MNPLADTWHMAQRHLRALIRQPMWIVVTLIQPIIWLVLFGGLFTTMENTPGWPHGVTFLEFITPGVIVMTAFFSAGWNGMTMIDDLKRGIIDRFLVSPAARSSIILGRLLQGALTVAIQSAIALMQFLLLPLTFVAAAFIPLSLAPGWIATAAKFNPVNWGIEAGRSAAMSAHPDWGLILTRTGLLLALGVLMAAFATRAFRSYQRTV